MAPSILLLMSAPLETCCCEGAVLYLWTRQLSGPVKARIAGKSIKGQENLKEVLKLADAVHKTAGNRNTTGQVAAVEAQEVSAMARRGRGGTRGRGRGRGQQRGAYSQSGQSGTTTTAQTSQNWGPRHPDNPPDGSCRTHWKWGTNAYFCSDRAVCPWKDRIIRRPTSNQPQPQPQRPPQ